MNNNNKPTSGALPIGTILRSPKQEYKVEAVLGMGGFGITYKVSAVKSIQVENVTLQVKLDFAIKEFFMHGCNRGDNGSTVTFTSAVESDVKQSKQDFITEAKRLNKIGTQSKNIVKVNEVFEANDTAYYVMEYLDGGSLKDYVMHHGALSWDEAKDIIVPIAKAVSLLHEEKLLHMDIKPDNIMFKHDENGNVTPILIDFGIAKHFDSKGKPVSHTIAKGASDGYAPIEQYVGIDKFAPEIDVYALGATLLYMILGRHPEVASNMNDKYIEDSLPQNIGDNARQTIKDALKQNKAERIHDVNTFLNRIVKNNNYNSTTKKISVTNASNSKKKYYIVAIVCAIIGFCSAELFSYVVNNESDMDMEEPTNINIEESDTAYVSDNDMQNEGTLSNTTKTTEAQSSLKKEMQDYIDKANKCCDKVEKRSGSKAMIQELLDAKYFYYDKAQTIYRQLYGKGIERNTRIDKLVRREYEYWISKGNKLGSDKRKYALKKEYYENAYKLVKSERMRSYIEWLDKQLKNRRK